MKNRIKRLMALILAMAMCLSLLSANVWAAESEPSVEDNSVSEQNLEAEESSTIEAESSEIVITAEKSEQEEKEVEVDNAEESEDGSFPNADSAKMEPNQVEDTINADHRDGKNDSGDSILAETSSNQDMELNDQQTADPENSASLQTESIEENEIIQFGSYPQSQVKDKTILEQLKSKTGLVELDGKRYESKGEKWYLVEPIDWIVLNRTGDYALVLSEKVIDHGAFSTAWDKTDWDKSVVREWLNTDFISKAFSETEKNYIQVTNVQNSRGKDTSDKVFFLSREEMTQYGISTKKDRIVNTTAYSGANTYLTRDTMAILGLANVYGVYSWDGYMGYVPIDADWGCRPAMTVLYSATQKSDDTSTDIESYYYNPTSKVLSIWDNSGFQSKDWSNSSAVAEIVTIGKQVTAIPDNAFSSFKNVKKLYYLGSSADWEQISIGTGNKPLTDAKRQNNTVCLSFGAGEDETADQCYWYKYDDSLFSGNSNKFNATLAAFSLGLELSSWSSNNAIAQYKTSGDVGRQNNILTAYRLLGFEDIVLQNYDVPLSDTSDKVAYSFATKELDSDGKNYLVTVMIRGGGYGAEWASNFHVGNGSYHTGFHTPAKAVFQELTKYLSDHNLVNQNTRILISGYSRGSAVANLLSAQVDDAYKDSIGTNHIFSYCFAVPQAVNARKVDITSSTYNNIFCIVNRYDIVARVAMSDWGFSRYGQIKLFPVSEADESAMLGIFNTLIPITSQHYDILCGKKIDRPAPLTLADFKKTKADQTVEKANSLLVRILGEQKAFSEKYESGIRDFLGLIYNGDSKDVGIYQRFLNKYGEEGKADYATVREYMPVITGTVTYADFLKEYLGVLGALCYRHGASTWDIAEFYNNALKDLDVWATLSCAIISSFSSKSMSNVIAYAHYPQLYLGAVVSDVSYDYGSTTTLTKTNITRVIVVKNKVTVIWKKNAKGKGYQLQYSTDKKFKKSVNTIKISKNKTVKTTIKKPKKGTWYFRIRTVKGNDYSDWSVAKKVKIK